jgi:hypothetical protein
MQLTNDIMKTSKLFLPLLLLVLGAATGCKKFVDVTNPDTFTDPSFWKNENSVKSYSWEFYNLFPGYGNGSSTNGDFYFPGLTDDQCPSSFTQFAQTTAASNSSWDFSYIRKANIMLERIPGIADMTDEAKNHWLGIARFFRAFQYFKLVQTFGGVPWFSHSMDYLDSAQIYKPRDSHVLVMDSVLADLDFAIANLRANSGDNTVNKDVALALKSRVCLFEGTYRKYHTELNAAATAGAYLQAAKDAAAQLMTRSYTLSADYQSNYNSADLSTNKEMILYKRYEPGYLQHSLIAYTYSSTVMSGPTKAAVESYLCSDGLPIGLSPLYKGDNGIANIRANRDKRLLQTIDTILCYNGTSFGVFTSSTGYKPIKFLPTGVIPNSEAAIATNKTDAPLFWLAEVYLNYAEACAELDQLGLYSITQADIDNTINKLRARGNVAKLLVNHQDVGFTDPKKDADVTPLIWEIRRERRVELMMDGFRFQDIMRWKKGNYMDSQKNPDSYLGAKVPPNGKVRLNANGYIMPYTATQQRTFIDPKNYLSAIPTNQILLYPADIQATMQNPGW